MEKPRQLVIFEMCWRYVDIWFFEWRRCDGDANGDSDINGNFDDDGKHDCADGVGDDEGDGDCDDWQ